MPEAGPSSRVVARDRRLLIVQTFLHCNSFHRTLPHIPSTSVLARARLRAVQRFTCLTPPALLVEGDFSGAARAAHPADSRCVLAFSTSSTAEDPAPKYPTAGQCRRDRLQVLRGLRGAAAIADPWGLAVSYAVSQGDKGDLLFSNR